jgi:hypothetical protein
MPGCLNDSSADVNHVIPPPAHQHHVDDDGPEYLKVLDGLQLHHCKQTEDGGITKTSSTTSRLTAAIVPNPLEIDRSHFSHSIQLLGIGKRNKSIITDSFFFVITFN